MKHTFFFIIVSWTIIISLFQNVEQAHGLKTYLIVGERSSGKSTIGNCILSEGSSINDIKSVPFNTRETTTDIKANGNNQTRVIDTFGFGDQKADLDKLLWQLRKALDGDNYLLDAVLYVITNEPPSRGFFKLMQQDIFKNVARNNSILICNGCDEGWLDEERKKNRELNDIIENCGNLTYNFMINLDNNERALGARKQSIHDLKQFLKSQDFDKLDLSFMKEDNYQVFFLGKINEYKTHLIGTGIGVGVVGGLLAIAKVAGVLA